jgi:hypothetical protein
LTVTKEAFNFLDVNILAIDPGLGGALALYDGASLHVSDMPVFRRPMGQRQTLRAMLDETRLIRWIRTSRADLVVLEQVGGLPRQSAPAAFTFGRGVGVIVGAAGCYGVPLREVHSSTWKSALGVPADKKHARARASELLPAYAGLWPLAKHDGRAEAAMLALYAWQVFGPQGETK